MAIGKSISEIMREIDQSRKLGIEVSRLDETQAEFRETLKQLQNQFSLCALNESLQETTQQIYTYIDKTLTKKFDEYNNQIYSYLSQKPTKNEIEKMLQLKVNWKPFQTLQQELSILTTKFEKHVISDFKSFKKQMKIELAHKTNQEDDLAADLLNNEEMIQLKQRVNFIEKQFNELFNGGDDMLEDDDDYDSEEELDNINMGDDLELTLIRDKKKEEDPEIPSFQTIVPGKLEAEEENPSNPEIEYIHPKSIQENSGSQEIFTEKKREIKVVNSRIEKEEAKRQIDENQSRKQSRTGSRAGKSRGESRASSMERSIGMMGGTALTNLHKKFVMLKKEMEAIRNEIEGLRLNLQDNEKEVESSFNEISDLRQKIKELYETNSKMEMSFIKALRRRGIDRFKKEQTIKPVEASEIREIHEMIKEKHKRIVSLEVNVEQLKADTEGVKDLQKGKLNAVIESLHYLNNARDKTSKEFDTVKETVECLEENQKKELASVKVELEGIKGPITNMISNQERENEMLTTDIERHQNLFRVLFDDYLASLQDENETSHFRSHSVENVERRWRKGRNESPVVTLKSRFIDNMTDTKSKMSKHKGKSFILPRVPKIEKTDTSAGLNAVKTEKPEHFSRYL